MPGVHLLNMAVQLPQVALAVGKIPLAAVDEPVHQIEAGQAGAQGNQRQPEIGQQHHNGYADKGGRRCNHIHHPVAQAHADGVHIIGHSAEQVAKGGVVEPAQGDSVQLAGDVVAHVPHNALGGARQADPLNKGQPGGEQVKQQHRGADGQHLPGVQRAGVHALLNQAGDAVHAVRGEQGEYHADHSAGQSGAKGNDEFAQVLDQHPQGALHVLGLFDHPHGPPHTGVGHFCLAQLISILRHYCSSSSLSWVYAISLYSSHDFISSS